MSQKDRSPGEGDVGNKSGISPITEVRKRDSGFQAISQSKSCHCPDDSHVAMWSQKHIGMP